MNFDVDKIINDFVEKSEKSKLEKNFSSISYFDFLEKLSQKPKFFARNSAGYLSDMFDFYGSYEINSFGEKTKRWRVFDSVTDSKKRFKIIGNEEVQNYIVGKIKSFANQDRIGKMILLKGPTGTAKSTHLICIASAVQEFSKTEEGAVYTISWEIPYNFGEQFEFGIQLGKGSQKSTQSKKNIIKKTCDFNDSPLFILPKELRKEFLENLEKEHNLEGQLTKETNLDGELCVNCNRIYNRLLNHFKGDHRKVWEYVQVDRMILSLFGNTGVIKIDPQKNPDFNVREEKIWGYRELPSIMHDISFMTPSSGGIHRGNRGMIEYSDIFKRSSEYLKCLLDVVQEGIISEGSIRVNLDSILFATSNEEDFLRFTQDPLYVPFRRRLDAVDLGYSLKISDEIKIHSNNFDFLKTQIEFCPFTEEALSTWAVTTRMEQPVQTFEDYEKEDLPTIAKITPLLKALVYDQNELPQSTLNLSGQKTEITYQENIILQKNLKALRNEWKFLKQSDKSFKYEGLIGASPTVIETILQNLSSGNPNSITYLDVIKTIQNFVDKNSLHYAFIGRGNDPNKPFYFLDKNLAAIEDYYNQQLVKSILDASGIIVESDLETKLEKYINCLKTHLTKEKSYFDPKVQKYVETDYNFMEEFEKNLEGFEKGNVENERSRIQFKLAEGIQNLKNNFSETEITPKNYKRILNREIQYYKSKIIKAHSKKLNSLILSSLNYLDKVISKEKIDKTKKIEDILDFTSNMKKLGFSERILRSLLGHLVSKKLLF